MAGLRAPVINTQDAGASDLSESSDEHFSSASEGGSDTARHSSDLPPHSPVPITRVERVDDIAAHGEVPNTRAYDMRRLDAVPDEIEIVPEGQRSRSGTQSRSRAASVLSGSSRPQTPGGSPIPRTVVDKVDDKPSYGEVEGTLAKEQRMADAEPDEVRTPSAGKTVSSQGRTVSDDPKDQQAWLRSMWEGGQREAAESAEKHDEIADDDDFGDDFDEFAEGGDDDFGDFDEPATVAAPSARSDPATTQPIPSALPDDLKFFDPTHEYDNTEFQDTLNTYLDTIFPDVPAEDAEGAEVDFSKATAFFSERSLSLWQQLVQPPPMQPPNWTRSRIRRLFLVSLGVPVDLDEILPPSKQKRLILPNINLAPTSTGNALERLRQADANDSTTSLDSKTGQPKKPKRTGTARGAPPPPDFDANSAALICGTTEEAMNGFEDGALKDHVLMLQRLNEEASAVLEYWLQRKDEAIKEKEALEGVIENLVGFVKGRRGK